MAFTIGEEADPLFQQIFFLLKPISGIEGQLTAAVDNLGKLVLDSSNALTDRIFSGFEQLAEEFEGQAQTRVDDTTNIIDTIIQNARIDFGTVTDFIDLAAEDARVEALRQAGITRREIEQAAAVTAAAVEESSKESNKALDFMGDVIGNAIGALPGGIGEGLKPIFDDLRESLEAGDAALGDGFGFLGASNLLGFGAISDILLNIFNIEPGDMQKAFESIGPLMAEMAKNSGDDIIAVGE